MSYKGIILGTAGHIDHGKTALIKALTGIDTDRLKEEKERGITIELGFAHLKLSDDIIIGIVDVPGHERFVKNMVAGASGIDLVLMVIAADEGVMPQTVEHLEICELLGIKTGLIAITKVDLVERDWLELVKEDILNFTKDTFLKDAPIIPVSSVTGEGIESLKKEIAEIVKKIKIKTDEGPFRLPVDRVFTIKGFGTVVTGTGISGSIKKGDQVIIYPKGLKTKIRNIQVHSQDVEEIKSGFRTALNLQSIEKDEIERGDVIATPYTLKPSYLLDLEFRYLESAERPLKYKSPVRLHIGTSEVLGHIFFPKEQIEPGEKLCIQIRLSSPIAVLRGDRYVLRSYSPVRTIGGGVVLNPIPKKRKRHKKDHWEELNFLSQIDDKEVIYYYLSKAQNGLTLNDIGLRSGVWANRLESILRGLIDSNKVIFIDELGKYFSSKVIETLNNKLVNILSDYHSNHPLDLGMDKEELRSKSESYISDNKLFSVLLSDLIKKGVIEKEKELLRIKGFSPKLSSSEQRLYDDIEALYRESGLKPPLEKELVKKFNKDSNELKKIIELLLRRSVIVKIKEGFYIHKNALTEIKEKLFIYFKTHQEIGVPEFRDLTGGISRKYLIPLLEYLDSQKITIRVGDKRRLRSN